MSQMRLPTPSSAPPPFSSLAPSFHSSQGGRKPSRWLVGCVGRGGRQVWWLLAWPALQEIWDDGAQASGCDKPVLPAGGHQDQPPAIPHELFWATAEWGPDWILKPCPQTLRAPASCRLQLSPGLSVRASSSPTSRTFHQGSLGGLIAVQSCIPLKIGAYFKCFSLNQ